MSKAFAKRGLKWEGPMEGEVQACLQGLPMGWSWAFFYVQAMHEMTAASAGFGTDQRITALWPLPSITDGPAALPYCDNLTVVGVDKEKVNAGLS